MIKTMENSNTYIYYSYLFGPREPWQWLFLSDTFQFIIYVILSYPFAWAICIIASISSNKWKHFSDFLAQFIMLALWLLRLWLILFLQIYIRKLFAKFGMTGTIIASIFCAWGLHQLLDFFVRPHSLFPRYLFG